MPCLQAAAVSAAAAVSCRVVSKTLGEVAAAGEAGLLQQFLQQGEECISGCSGPEDGLSGKQLQPLQQQAASQEQQQQQHQGPGHEEQQEAAAGAGAALAVLLLVDVSAAGAPLDAGAAAALQRLSSPAPCVVTGSGGACRGAAAAGSAAARAAAGTLPFRVVHLVLLCAESQSAQLQGLLGPQCYQLALPAASREQLEGDCRAQLMQQCSAALVDHIQDAARGSSHHQQGQQLLQQQQHHQDDDGRHAAPQQQQQQQQGPDPVTAGAMPAARRLAERLAAVVAKAHLSALAAYTRRYNTHVGASKAVNALSSSKGSGGGSSCSMPWTAHDLACQAVPLSKPSDAVCSMQVLLRNLRQPLPARRSALAAGLEAAGRFITSLSPAAADCTAAMAAAAVTSTAGGEQDSAVTNGGHEAAAAVPPHGQLLGDLGALQAKWAAELVQVRAFTSAQRRVLIAC